jgi:hypothetical protein
MNFLISKMKNFLLFLKNKELSLVIISILFFPLAFFLKNVDGDFGQFLRISISLSIFLFSLFLIFNEKLEDKIINWFKSLCSTFLFQHFLLTGLITEQICLGHILFNIMMGINIATVFLNALNFSSLWCIFYQFLWILFILYYRIRKKIMNADMFKEAGLFIPEDKPLSWPFILNGINCVLNHKSLQQQKATGSAVGAAQNSEGSAPFDIVPTNRQSIPQSLPIMNRIPAASNLHFPFFPLPQQRRHLGSRARAVGGFTKFIQDSFQASPAGTAAAVIGGVTGTATAGIHIYSTREQLKQNEHHHQETIAESRVNRELERQKHEETIAALRANRELEERKLDLERQKHEENIAALRANRELETRKLDLIESGKWPASASVNVASPIKHDTDSTLGKGPKDGGMIPCAVEHQPAAPCFASSFSSFYSGEPESISNLWVFFDLF